jgi:hypothetical protein
MKERNWRDFNRANWDERVKLHLRSESYDLGPLRSGHGKLTPIEEREIGPLQGMRILHLQCHFGRDTLAFAQRGYASTELLQNTTTYEWLHPLGEIVTSLLAAGLSLKWLHEHDSVAWRMFERLVKDRSGMHRWPDQPWFPLAFSLRAERLPG